MKVFISYHKNDTHYKNKIVSILKKEGIEYSMVPRNCILGECCSIEMQRIIKSRIEDCDLTICIIGKETYLSPHIDHELKVTLDHDMGILGILLETRSDRLRNLRTSTLPKRIAVNYENDFPGIKLAQYANIDKVLYNHLEDILENHNEPDLANNDIQLMTLVNKLYY
jgi:hypothetical protein